MGLPAPRLESALSLAHRLPVTHLLLAPTYSSRTRSCPPVGERAPELSPSSGHAVYSPAPVDKRRLPLWGKSSYALIDDLTVSKKGRFFSLYDS